MKISSLKLLCLFIVGAAIVIGCKKTELRSIEYALPTDKAYVRFALLSPNTPSVMIKVNDVKVNGSSTSGNGGIFPAIINTPDYSAVTPGGTFRLSLPNIATTNDSVLIFTGKLGTEAGKFYSVALADTGIDRAVFANEDIFQPMPKDSMMNIRFINAMAKSQPLSFIRIDSSATTVKRDTLFSNIAFKQASDYITIPVYPVNGILKFRTIVTSTGQLVGSGITVTASSSLRYRSVTFYGYGFANGTGTYAPSILGPVYNK